MAFKRPPNPATDIHRLRQMTPQQLLQVAVAALRPPYAWKKDGREPIYYEEWAYLAGYHPDQPFTWRCHERNARLHAEASRDFDFDLGGEA